MATGIVRSFNDSKGFGLIAPDTGGPPLFARGDCITSPGVKKLKALQRVRYEVTESGGGLFATNIMVVHE
jgi:cold shock protein